MDGTSQPPLIASPARRRAAAALRALNAEFLSRSADDAVLRDISEVADRFAELLRAGESRRRSFDEIVAEQKAPEIADGAEIDFFDQNFLTGGAHPLSVPARYRRDGDALEVSTRIGVEHEGMPGFAHGGILLAHFDNLIGLTMGRMRRSPAPTVRVEASFHRPVPLDTDVCFRAWPEGVEGRKHTVAASVTGDGVTYASAIGLLVVLSSTQLTSRLG